MQSNWKEHKESNKNAGRLRKSNPQEQTEMLDLLNQLEQKKKKRENKKERAHGRIEGIRYQQSVLLEDRSAIQSSWALETDEEIDHVYSLKLHNPCLIHRLHMGKTPGNFLSQAQKIIYIH